MGRYIAITFFIILTSCISNKSDEELKAAYVESIDKGNWSKALSYVEEGLIRNPNDTLLYFSKAVCLNKINPTKNNELVTKNINIFLENYKTSSKGRLLKYINHYENKQYDKAINEVFQIEKYYGVSTNTLVMKANAQFLNKSYKNATFNYDEALSYKNSKEKIKVIYYYKIYSKYFAGNKEGALWDTAFLEDYGFEKDEELMKLISDDKLDINDFNKIPFYAEAITFDKEIRPKINLALTSFYKPIFEDKLFQERQYKVKDLKFLNKNIEFLNLSNGDFLKLPDDITQFKKLKALRISRSKIRDFDKLFNQLSKLKSLEYLDLDYSNLKKFPTSISKLPHLKGLSVSESNISELPKEIGRLYNLSYLNLKNNKKLTELPKDIKYLKNLNSLDISGTGIQKLRDELTLCYNLISMKANASKIKAIPQNLIGLRLLNELNLSFNEIETIPESIGELNYLKNLSLGSNYIEKLPNSIDKLKNLEFLGLEFNRFKKFPRNILELDNLNTLWLHNNFIPEIPIDIGKLNNLKYLLLDHQIIKEDNINNIKKMYPKINITREDSRKYVAGIKRKN